MDQRCHKISSIWSICGFGPRGDDLAGFLVSFLPASIEARTEPGWSTIPNGRVARTPENLFRIGSESWFREMGKYAKPDAHLYEVCYLLDEAETPAR